MQVLTNPGRVTCSCKAVLDPFMRRTRMGAQFPRPSHLKCSDPLECVFAGQGDELTAKYERRDTGGTSYRDAS